MSASNGGILNSVTFSDFSNFWAIDISPNSLKIYIGGQYSSGSTNAIWAIINSTNLNQIEGFIDSSTNSQFPV